MLEVNTLSKDGEILTFTFDSTAIEIIDGALVILTKDAKGHIAGFAPGHWLSFQTLDPDGTPYT